MIEPFPSVKEGQWPPDYTKVFVWRQRQLMAIRANPVIHYGAIQYYSTHPHDFIEHWLDTYDPRLATDTNRPARLPFIMFKRQRELITFLNQLVFTESNGLVEKCRDVGATWLACAFSVWLWRFLPGAAVGWGSRKQELVDELGIADSILEKMRILIRFMPAEFWPVGFDPKKHMPFMRILNPETQSSITGETGDDIGRGGRKLIYFKDESAHYEHPEKIEAALSENTRVAVDISSVNGLGNVFQRRRETGEDWIPVVPMMRRAPKTQVFVFDWRDHPEKTPEWYKTRKTKWTDEGLGHIFAQEVDRDYAASLEGLIIQRAWVQAAVDADKALGFTDEGLWFAAQDIADEGGDKNAQIIRKGPCLKFADHWGEGDTGKTARRALKNLREVVGEQPCDFNYDSLGVGAGFKAETNRLVEEKLISPNVRFIPWAASFSPLYPKRRMIPGDAKSMLNEDYFDNIKVQAWWQVARRFEKTWRMRNGEREYDPGELISIPSTLPARIRFQLEKELCQVQQGLSPRTMKMIIIKKPEGTVSPNLGDGVVMAYWPISSAGRYSEKIIG